MSHTSETPPSATEAPATAKVRRNTKGGDDSSAEEVVVSPTLATYFGTSPVPAAAFVKAVRTGKVRRFTEADIQEASALIASTDAHGRRLLALASLSKLPDAIERWVWVAVQQRIRAVLPSDFDPLQADAVETYDTLLRQISSSISSGEDKDQREVGETLLRLCLVWLVSRRSLDNWTAFEKLKATFFKDDVAAAKAARKVLTRGKIADISNASAVAGLARETIREARSEAEIEKRRQATLQSQLNAAHIAIAEIRGEVERVSRERDSLVQQLQEVKAQFEQSRQHSGHDITDLKTRQNALLQERVVPMVSDAIDALEMDPPAPDIAVRRLKLALSSIETEKQ